MTDHIADADKKVQPARCPHCGYTSDAIPSDFDAYAQANCEHRESHGHPAPLPRAAHAFDCPLAHPLGKICTCGVGAHAPKPAPAPLPGGVESDLEEATAVLRKVQDVLRNEDLLFAAEGLRSVFHALSHISDLTRRLAEVEQAACEALAGAHAEQEVSRHWKEEAYGLKSIVDAAGKLHREIAEALGRKDMPTDLLVLAAKGLRERCGKLEAVREETNRFLTLVNAVTAPHRHGQAMRKGALDNLSNGQLEVEAALAAVEVKP